MTIPADDRGFTLGDGLFETVLARAGELVLWDAHKLRLARGCAVLGLPAPDPEVCAAAAAEALAEAGLAEARAAVRLSWTAGSGGRGLERPAELVPRLVVHVAAAPRPETPAILFTAETCRNDASPVSRLKTLSYLDQVLARREAAAAGADEALMLNTRGELACCAASNLFWRQGRTLFTPALDCGVLDGVMRGALIERARVAGYDVREVRSHPVALEVADAVFLTNSLVGARCVAAVDDRQFELDGALTALVDAFV